MMTESICISCRRPKAKWSCGVCSEALCKSCVRFLPESTFSFLSELPEALSHAQYCNSCYQSHVEPELHAYEETEERARGLYFFFETQRATIHLLKRSKEKVEVKACDDRNETILRLAFQAAKLGFNAVIEAKVVAKQIRNEGYQKSQWTGVGIPAQVDSAKLERMNSYIK